MAHVEEHKFGGFCLCTCEECFTPTYIDDTMKWACDCPDGCNCNRNMGPLHAAYYAKPETKPQHTCEKCGVEVFRNGDRGRFPKRCLECKC